MNKGYRTRAFWILSSALVVALLAVITIALLRWQAENSRRTQDLITTLEITVHDARSAEQQALARGSVDAKAASQIQQTRAAVSKYLSQLLAAYDSPAVRRIAADEKAYSAAADEALRLLSVGQTAAAKRVASQRVDPLAEALRAHVASTARDHAATTERQIRAADIGSALTAIAAIILLGNLLFTFDRSRRSAQQAEVEKKALESSEERFRNLVQNSSDVTMILAPDGAISYVSTSAAHVFDCMPEDVLGKSLLEVADARDVPDIEAWLRLCVDEPDSMPLIEFRCGHTHTDRRHIEAIGKNQLDSPAIGGIVANMRDVTERKRTEAQIARQRVELQERNVELAALQQISEVVSSTNDMDELMEKVLHTIAGIDIFRECTVGGILTLEGEKLGLASCVGNPAKPFLELHETIGLGECLCGLCAQTGELIVSVNCDTDERHTVRYPGMKPHGHVIVPLQVRERVVGVLYLYVPVGTQVSERTQQTLLAVGDQIGTAIENVRLYERTKELSLHDPLTGLANRRLMHIAVQENFARARRLGRQFSIVMMDLDFFKKYNDTYGHAAGDHLLAEVANLILREIREIDLAVRYGGEEFLIILPEARKADAVEVAERIRNRVMDADFFHAADMPPSHITVSLGVASYSKSLEGEAALIRMADQAMYAAKREGRNKVEVAKK